MTPFQLGLLAGGFLGFLVGVIIMGVLSILKERRGGEIGRDAIARMKKERT